MDIFVMKLRNAMYSRGMKQVDLARATGLTDSQISSWYNGRYRPNAEALAKIAKALGVSPAYLLGQEEVDPRAIGPNEIAILGSVAAGIPITEQPDIIGTVYTEDDQKDLYALKIKGDSMSPRIMDGDLVIVHSQPDADDGELVVARVDGDVTCKVLKKNRHSVSLISFNAAYAPIVLVEGAPLEIIGKVVESRHEWK